MGPDDLDFQRRPFTAFNFTGALPVSWPGRYFQKQQDLTWVCWENSGFWISNKTALKVFFNFQQGSRLWVAGKMLHTYAQHPFNPFPPDPKKTLASDIWTPLPSQPRFSGIAGCVQPHHAMIMVLVPSAPKWHTPIESTLKTPSSHGKGKSHLKTPREIWKFWANNFVQPSSLEFSQNPNFNKRKPQKLEKCQKRAQTCVGPKKAGKRRWSSMFWEDLKKFWGWALFLPNLALLGSAL